jgi:hypothetical protein
MAGWRRPLRRISYDAETGLTPENTPGWAAPAGNGAGTLTVIGGEAALQISGTAQAGWTLDAPAAHACAFWCEIAVTGSLTGVTYLAAVLPGADGAAGVGVRFRALSNYLSIAVGDGSTALSTSLPKGQKCLLRIDWANGEVRYFANGDLFRTDSSLAALGSEAAFFPELDSLGYDGTKPFLGIAAHGGTVSLYRCGYEELSPS